MGLKARTKRVPVQELLAMHVVHREIVRVTKYGAVWWTIVVADGEHFGFRRYVAWGDVDLPTEQQAVGCWHTAPHSPRDIAPRANMTSEDLPDADGQVELQRVCKTTRLVTTYEGI